MKPVQHFVMLKHIGTLMDRQDLHSHDIIPCHPCN